jgi:hypothetical protein
MSLSTGFKLVLIAPPMFNTESLAAGVAQP